MESHDQGQIYAPPLPTDVAGQMTHSLDVPVSPLIK